MYAIRFFPEFVSFKNRVFFTHFISKHNKLHAYFSVCAWILRRPISLFVWFCMEVNNSVQFESLEKHPKMRTSIWETIELQRAFNVNKTFFFLDFPIFPSSWQIIENLTAPTQMVRIQFSSDLWIFSGIFMLNRSRILRHWLNLPLGGWVVLCACVCLCWKLCWAQVFFSCYFPILFCLVSC